MKKSVYKIANLAIAAVVMLIVSVSASTAFAENNYTSKQWDFSSATGITCTNNISATANGNVMQVTDGVLKYTRTHFHTSSTPSSSSKALIPLDKTFSEGKVQAKFDFKLTGSVNQSFVASFDGYQGKDDTGILIGKSWVKLIYPAGNQSSAQWYNSDKTRWLLDDTEYTATIVLDIASGKYTLTIAKKSDASVVKTMTFSIGTNWGSYTKGAVKGISFWSLRGEDKGDDTATSSVLIVDNLSVDAYTETNYEIGSVYRSTDGLETNKKTDGYSFKGVSLSRLTNFADPANAGLITASYASTRMEDVLITPLSDIGTAPVHADISGDTVKSFIFDMNTAVPFVDSYQYADPATTVRKIDFEEDFAELPTSSSGFLDTSAMTTYGINKHVTWPGVTYAKVSEGDNGVLRVRRSTFRNSTPINYYWVAADNAWKKDAPEPGNSYFTVKLDKAAAPVEVSFKFKFEGTENSSQTQKIAVTMGGKLVLISRDQSGSGKIECGYSGTSCSWSDMKAGEWYTFTGKITETGFTCSVKGDFTSGYATKTGSNTQTASVSDNVQIGSNRGEDIISVSLEEVKTTASVWYIDDVVIKY